MPHIGWVFVNRLPVRGPLSRKSVARGQAQGPQGRRPASATVRAGQPRGQPADAGAEGAAARRARRQGSGQARRRRADAERGRRRVKPTSPARPPRPRRAPATVNDLLPFLTFVEHHPLGHAASTRRRLATRRTAPTCTIGDVARLRAAAADGRPGAAQRPRVHEGRRRGHARGRELRPGPAQHRPGRAGDGARPSSPAPKPAKRDARSRRRRGRGRRRSRRPSSRRDRPKPRRRRRPRPLPRAATSSAVLTDGRRRRRPSRGGGRARRPAAPVEPAATRAGRRRSRAGRASSRSREAEPPSEPAAEAAAPQAPAPAARRGAKKAAPAAEVVEGAERRGARPRPGAPAARPPPSRRQRDRPSAGEDGRRATRGTLRSTAAVDDEVRSRPATSRRHRRPRRRRWLVPSRGCASPPGTSTR